MEPGSGLRLCRCRFIVVKPARKAVIPQQCATAYSELATPGERPAHHSPMDPAFWQSIEGLDSTLRASNRTASMQPAPRRCTTDDRSLFVWWHQVNMMQMVQHSTAAHRHACRTSSGGWRAWAQSRVCNWSGAHEMEARRRPSRCGGAALKRRRCLCSPTRTA